MVDNAFFDEGGDDWTATGKMEDTPIDFSAQQQPMMMMQQQDADKAFDDFLPEAAPIVTIQTASGAAQNIEDDLTEEEREIVAKAAEFQEQLKQEIHNLVI